MKFNLAFHGAIASVLSLGVANAADLPSAKGPSAYAPPASVAFSWTGWRLGLNGGWGGGSVDTTASFSASPAGTVPGFAALSSFGAAQSGGLAGGQNSMLWQLSCNVVIGYESDFQWSGLRGARSQWGLASRTGLDWFGTERVRLGYAFGRFLPYVTAGLSYGKTTSNLAQVFANGAFSGARSTVQAGWAAGGGVEYAITDHISVKAEYLYMQLQGVQGFGAGLAAGSGGAVVLAPYRYNSGVFGTHIARAGVNFKIDSIGAVLGVPGLGRF